MTTHKVKVTPPGATEPVEVDVDLSTLPETAIADVVKGKYIPTATFESELARRGLSIAKNQGYRKEDEFLGDDAFKTKALEAWGVKPGTATAGTDGENAEKLATRIRLERQAWEERELNPKLATAKADAEKTAAQINKLVTRGLQKEIVAAASQAGLKQALLKAADPKQIAPVVAMMGHLFGYDPGTDNYYVKDGEGFAFSSRATKDAPYMTVAEYLDTWATNKDNAEFIASGRQTGPGLGGSGGGGGQAKDGTIYLTAEEYADPAKYDEALKKVNGAYEKVQLARSQQQTF